jgi:hypothetical protein
MVVCTTLSRLSERTLTKRRLRADRRPCPSAPVVLWQDRAMRAGQPDSVRLAFRGRQTYRSLRAVGSTSFRALHISPAALRAAPGAPAVLPLPAAVLPSAPAAGTRQSPASPERHAQCPIRRRGRAPPRSSRRVPLATWIVADPGTQWRHAGQLRRFSPSCSRASSLHGTPGVLVLMRSYSVLFTRPAAWRMALSYYVHFRELLRPKD